MIIYIILQLEYLNIKSNYKVFFTNGKSKGNILKTIINKEFIDKEFINEEFINNTDIIFVDDLQSNIDDVYEHVNNIRCYLYS
jgi:hypothetical protein